MLEAIIYSSMAGLATGLGALFVVIFGRPSVKFLSVMLGFAGGVMLSVSAFELLPEARELGGSVAAVVGVVAGAVMMMLLDVVIPHIHRGFRSSEGLPAAEAAATNELVVNGRLTDGRRSGELSCNNLLRCGIFLVIGIALHNLPEGLAIGAGYTSSSALGAVIVVSLALHNVPEGMVTAAPLLLGGMQRWRVVLLTTIAGLMTPIGTAIGGLLFVVSKGLVGGALAFAAGAMVYIVSDELIPQSHQYHSHAANVGLIVGFLSGFVFG